VVPGDSGTNSKTSPLNIQKKLLIECRNIDFYNLSGDYFSSPLKLVSFGYVFMMGNRFFVVFAMRKMKGTTREWFETTQ
jgi:hypothetical protein